MRLCTAKENKGRLHETDPINTDDRKTKGAVCFMWHVFGLQALIWPDLAYFTPWQATTKGKVKVSVMLNLKIFNYIFYDIICWFQDIFHWP